MYSNEHDTFELKTLLDYLKGFKSFVNTTTTFFLGLIRKKILLLLAPILVVGAYGFYKFTKTEALYNVEMQLSFNELYKRTYGEMTLRLQNHLADQDYAIVARELQMSPEEVKNIVKITALNIARSPLHEDVSSDKVPFYVLAELRDKNISEKLQKGIITYFKNNPLNQERRRVNLANLKDRLVFLEKQIAWMDSIKINYNQQLKKGIKSEQLNSEMSIDKLFALSDTFYTEWLSVRSGLSSYEAVEVVFGFTPSDNPVKPSLLSFLFKYLIIGIVISLCLLLWFAIPVNSKS